MYGVANAIIAVRVGNGNEWKTFTGLIRLARHAGTTHKHTLAKYVRNSWRAQRFL